MNLHVLNFNNYYNRIVKVDTTEATVVHTQYDVNFNPNDGVVTEHIIGAMEVYDGSGDYVIIEDNDNIVSRWWIIEQQRTRNGQYRVSLKRDVIADYYDIVVNSPCFIEKATLNMDNPLIFNKENMGFNQIKTKETTIKDKSKIPWVVFYMDRTVTGQQQFTIPTSTVNVNGEYDSIENYPYYDYCSLNSNASEYYGNYSNLTFGMNVLFGSSGLTPSTWYRYFWNSGVTWVDRESYGAIGPEGYVTSLSRDEEIIATITDIAKDYEWYNTSYSYTKANSATNLNNFLEEQGKLYYINGKYYRVNIEQQGSFTETVTINPSTGLGIYYESIYNNLNSPSKRGDESPYNIRYTVPTYRIVLVEETYASYTLTIPESRTHCADAPYDVLCIPCGDIILDDDGTESRLSSDLAFKFAAEIGKKANTQIFDVQLLPYCPLDDSIFETSLTSVSTMTPSDLYTEGTDYFFIKEGNVNRSVCFSVATNKYRKFIDGPVIKQAETAIERKVNNECDLYRLCSPNYDGVFEFSAEKNGGVNRWVVNLTYKPYTPYICVSPMFNNLYGRNFNDSRGLICGGEFSLPRVTSNWETYELNNKNYQRSFDRQIENMDFNNGLQMAQATIGAITGTLTGAGAGAFAGSMIPGGTAVGAAIGGAASLAGGIADINILAQQQKETLDYTKDLFGYQLGNIKALPHTLNKIGSFDITNKIFPFIEFYTSTDVEKEALRDKIKYNGMTTMAIGTIINYIQPEPSYIKGSLIRCEGVEDDYHLVLAIAEELNKGVYI